MGIDSPARSSYEIWLRGAALRAEEEPAPRMIVARIAVKRRESLRAELVIRNARETVNKNDARRHPGVEHYLMPWARVSW